MARGTPGNPGTQQEGGIIISQGVRAEEVRQKLERVIKALEEARIAAFVYSGCPAYVYRKMDYFIRKICDLQEQAEALKEKIPEKFALERR